MILYPRNDKTSTKKVFKSYHDNRSYIQGHPFLIKNLHVLKKNRQIILASLVEIKDGLFDSLPG